MRVRHLDGKTEHRETGTRELQGLAKHLGRHWQVLTEEEMFRVAATLLSRSTRNIAQARRRNSVKSWHSFLWLVVTRVTSICLSSLGDTCGKSELILGCLGFFPWAKIMERNTAEKLQNIRFLWKWLMGQMATVCKKNYFTCFLRMW